MTFTIFSFSRNPCKFQPPKTEDVRMPQVFKRGFESDFAGPAKVHILVSKYFGTIGSNPNSAKAENRRVQGCACITQG